MDGGGVRERTPKGNDDSRTRVLSTAVRGMRALLFVSSAPSTEKTLVGLSHILPHFLITYHWVLHWQGHLWHVGRLQFRGLGGSAVAPNAPPP